MKNVIDKLIFLYNNQNYETLLDMLLCIDIMVNKEIITKQINDICYLHKQLKCDQRDIVIKNLLGVEKGIYKLPNIENVICLYDINLEEMLKTKIK